MCAHSCHLRRPTAATSDPRRRSTLPCHLGYTPRWSPPLHVPRTCATHLRTRPQFVAVVPWYAAGSEPVRQPSPPALGRHRSSSVQSPALPELTTRSTPHNWLRQAAPWIVRRVR